MVWQTEDTEVLRDDDGRAVEIDFMGRTVVPQSTAGGPVRHGFKAIAFADSRPLFEVTTEAQATQLDAARQAVKEDMRRRVLLGDWTRGSSYRITDAG
jgi:hypothetical protein